MGFNSVFKGVIKYTTPRMKGEKTLRDTFAVFNCYYYNTASDISNPTGR